MKYGEPVKFESIKSTVELEHADHVDNALVTELESYRAGLHELAALLGKAAEALDRTEELPSEETVLRLQHAREQFAQLQQRALGVALEWLPAPPAAPGSVSPTSGRRVRGWPSPSQIR